MLAFPVEVKDGLIQEGEPFWVRRNHSIVQVTNGGIVQDQFGRDTYLVGDGTLHYPGNCYATAAGASLDLRQALERRRQEAQAELVKIGATIKTIDGQFWERPKKPRTERLELAFRDLLDVADRVRCEYESGDQFTGSYDLSNPLEKALAELLDRLLVWSEFAGDTPAHAAAEEVVR